MSISREEIRKELTNEIRNANIITQAARGVTNTTEEFDGDGAQTAFILTGTGTGDGGIKNVRSVTVGGVTQAFGSVWNLSGDFHTVTFATAPASGTDNVDIDYDYSLGGDKIYPDLPKETLSVNQYPRLGFEIISETTTPKSLQGASLQTNLIMTFVIAAETPTAVQDFFDALRTFLVTQQTSWYYLSFLTPIGSGPLLETPGTNQKIFQRSTDCSAPFEFELKSG